jgi:BirA family transcriptional regulator, biotin operon repressor / biotin---[acetyl-CoA-carboxylase] ligase
MNEDHYKENLSSLPLGGLRYFDSTGSTNDEALKWASEGASDLSLVISDEQTAGRGRSGRKWYSPPKSALACSLILRPSPAELKHLARITGLGALAIIDSLRSLGLFPQIKWPNDILINGRKVAGILVESDWLGNNLEASILGLGVNVLMASKPPSESVDFPATCIEVELGHSLDRIELLKEILSALFIWRKKIGGDEFIQAWEDTLAFRGRQVEVITDSRPPVTGELVGLEPNGNLQVRSLNGNLHLMQFGEIHLRPAL